MKIEFSPTNQDSFGKPSLPTRGLSSNRTIRALAVAWLIIIVPLIIYSLFIEVSETINLYLVVIQSVITALLFVATGMSANNSINELTLNQKQLSLNIDSLDDLISQRDFIEAKESFNKFREKLEAISHNQNELSFKLTALEINVKNHKNTHSISDIKDNLIEPEIKGAISVKDLIGALNFPKDEKDTEGFRKLRLALADEESGDLLRASQDIQTLLSHDGIYMDDLDPEISKPEIWRRFSNGERGPIISALGQVQNDETIYLISKKVKTDEIFRDACYHFLRCFDTALGDFCKKANDDELMRFSSTRTARAFMLLGSATGRFN
ncbi:MAG: hypothetical protein O3A15_04215 [Proteobacteria bacterium]|jgi:hypothetical protein|nr:hypothetical protein [Pseudomonadota bacterium]